MAPRAIDLVSYAGVSDPTLGNDVGIGIVQRIDINLRPRRVDERGVEVPHFPFQKRSHLVAHKDLKPGDIDECSKAHLLAIGRALDKACETARAINEAQETGRCNSRVQSVTVFTESIDAIIIFYQHLKAQDIWRIGSVEDNLDNCFMVAKFRCSYWELASLNVDLQIDYAMGKCPEWPTELQHLQRIKARLLANDALSENKPEDQ